MNKKLRNVIFSVWYFKSSRSKHDSDKQSFSLRKADFNKRGKSQSVSATFRKYIEDT